MTNIYNFAQFSNMKIEFHIKPAASQTKDTFIWNKTDRPILTIQCGCEHQRCLSKVLKNYAVKSNQTTLKSTGSV